MKAQNKQTFIEQWKSYANEFKALGHSAETAESFEAIKAQVKEMKKVIEKIAIECYDKES